mmetsp:Transcript_38468/g.71413  ORF Transcript_38468/g.71413 Transcript_38468/m.71413 type:complete len:958 (+) Transcript_38468:68-2941(+)
MSLTAHKIALLLLGYLTCTGHGRRAQPLPERLLNAASAERSQEAQTDEASVAALAKVLKAFEPSTGFNSASTPFVQHATVKSQSPRTQLPSGRPTLVASPFRASLHRRPHGHHSRFSQPQMMFERFSESAIQIIMMAQRESQRLGHNYVGNEMMLLGVVAQKSGVAAKVLAKLGVKLEEMRKVVEELVGKGNGITGVDIPVAKEAKEVLEGCVEEAEKLGSKAVDTVHILLALIKDEDGDAAKILKKLSVDPAKVRTEVLDAVKSQDKPLVGAVSSSGGAKSGKSNTATLEQYARDLTKMAEAGELDVVIGREKEIKRAVQVLARRRKNNPVLIGEPGVGKTAIAEGLAQRIADGKGPSFLQGKRIMQLDLTGLLAGTKYRGDFEERLQNVIKEVVASNREIVLMIDELHMLVGAGSAEGSMDAGNMLKPMLANGELQLIGATTLEEYRKYIEKDKALERRFQTINVPEPTADQATDILKGLTYKYEEHHELRYTPEAIEACVKLADRYITDRYLPDKAIDILDETGARVRLQAAKAVPKETLEIETELKEVQKQLDEAVEVQDFEKAAELKPKKDKLNATLMSLGEGEEEKAEKTFVSESDVERIVADMTGIRVEKVSSNESARLLGLEDTLHDRVIGQDEAVVAVSKAVRRSRSGLKDPNRPIASFIFCGPTGVGKTELCKALSDAYYGRKDSMIRFDMSEFMERHTVSKLIGSPPGYVGYNDESQLTDKVRRNPYSLILFDEIEKAHPDVFNLLLQILEDGRLTDSKGRLVSFKNALIIMTSNVGAQNIEKTVAGGGGFGFQSATDDVEQATYEKMKSVVGDQLKNNFKPEFINRLDDTIVFKPLTKKEIEQIAELELAKVFERVKEQGLTIEMTERFKKKCVDDGFDPKFGARPLRRAIAKLLEDELAASVLLEPVRENEIAIVDIDDDGKVKILRNQGEVKVTEEEEAPVLR